MEGSRAGRRTDKNHQNEECQHNYRPIHQRSLHYIIVISSWMDNVCRLGPNLLKPGLVILEKRGRAGYTLKKCNRYIPLPPIGVPVKARLLHMMCQLKTHRVQ